MPTPPCADLHRRFWPRLARCTAWASAALLLGACSSVRPWLNQPMPLPEESAEVRKAVLQHTAARDPSMLVAVTLSGGGARASAFGFGVLSALQQARYHWKGRDTTLLNATDVVSGVSGGSIIAAYFAAYGIDGLPGFEQAFLRQNFQNSLISQALRPGNLVQLSSARLGWGARTCWHAAWTTCTAARLLAMSSAARATRSCSSAPPTCRWAPVSSSPGTSSS